MKPSDFIKDYDYLNNAFPYVINEGIVRLVFQRDNIYHLVANQFWPERPRAA